MGWVTLTPHVCDVVPHTPHRGVKLGEGTGTRYIMETDHWLAVLQCSGKQRYTSDGWAGERARTFRHRQSDTLRGLMRETRLNGKSRPKPKVRDKPAKVAMHESRLNEVAT